MLIVVVVVIIIIIIIIIIVIISIIIIIIIIYIIFVGHYLGRLGITLKSWVVVTLLFDISEVHAVSYIHHGLADHALDSWSLAFTLPEEHAAHCSPIYV